MNSRSAGTWRWPRTITIDAHPPSANELRRLHQTPLRPFTVSERQDLERIAKATSGRGIKCNEHGLC
jgi:hypothetical protein